MRSFLFTKDEIQQLSHYCVEYSENANTYVGRIWKSLTHFICTKIYNFSYILVWNTICYSKEIAPFDGIGFLERTISAYSDVLF